MHTRRISILAAATITTMVLAACGSERSADNTAPPAADGTTVIDVTMTDMAFTPNALAVKAGETVTFRFRSNGQSIH